MAEGVLDASAILAVILEEPGVDRVEAYLLEAAASAVNIGEVVAKLRDLGMPERTVEEVVTGLQLDLYAHDVNAAFASGFLRERTRLAGLSLGDRACLALAQALQLPAVTTDRAWREVADAIGVRVDLIR
jgi:ribonuclease VapC